MHQERYQVTARTMSDALILARKRYGQDVMIESHVQGPGEVTLSVVAVIHEQEQENTHDMREEEPIIAPSLDAQAKASAPSRRTLAPDTPLTAQQGVQWITQTCSRHLLPYDFCIHWLEAAAPLLAGHAVTRAQLLHAVVPVSHGQEISADMKKEPVFLCGPAGSGKTSAAAKLAAMMVAENMLVSFINLDSFRAGAKEQLQSYADALELTVTTGLEQALTPVKAHKMQLIADTPALDLNKPHDRRFLEKLCNRIPVRLTPVIPAYLNAADARTLAKAVKYLPIDSVILTKTDLTECFGGALIFTHELNKPISFYGASPLIADGLHPMDATAWLRFLGEDA